MENVGMLVVIVGAMLVWAYYAPRFVATVRLYRDRRRMVMAWVNPLERLAPGDPAVDEAFTRLARELMVSDPVWARAMRATSRAARAAGRWVRLNMKEPTR